LSNQNNVLHIILSIRFNLFINIKKFDNRNHIKSQPGWLFKKMKMGMIENE